MCGDDDDGHQLHDYDHGGDDDGEDDDDDDEEEADGDDDGPLALDHKTGDVTSHRNQSRRLPESGRSTRSWNAGIQRGGLDKLPWNHISRRGGPAVRKSPLTSI